MTIFHYKAKKKNAETVMGQIDALNRDDAVNKIHDLGLVPVYIEEGKIEYSNAPVDLGRPRAVPAKEVYLFTRQLANLIKSGIPILRTLELISTGMKNSYFKALTEKIRSDVKDGRSFSDCLSDHAHIFDQFYVSMVRAGEESGNLKGTISDVADYLQEQEAVRSKVRGAIAYPGFMLAFGVGTVIYILVYVMPKITAIFENFDQELPATTRWVMGLSQFAIQFWWMILIAIGALALVIQQWDRTKEGKIYKSKVALGIPFFGDFLLKVDLARFCRTLQMLLKSGIPIVRAIQLAAPVVGNAVISQELQKCQDGLVAGRSLGQIFKEMKYVPAMLGDLIQVGEEAGSLSASLNDIAQTYEQETNESIKLMTTLLEPVMILVVGSVIGLIVIAMLLPIFQLDIFAR